MIFKNNKWKKNNKHTQVFSFKFTQNKSKNCLKKIEFFACREVTCTRAITQSEREHTKSTWKTMTIDWLEHSKIEYSPGSLICNVCMKIRHSTANNKRIPCVVQRAPCANHLFSILYIYILVCVCVYVCVCAMPFYT